jgi:uncharacterized protein (TIGR02680 family)
VNLWEYDDQEFWFADGRLVLRGGNGAGKTKALELTTLVLMRGEITPSTLDPFGSQHRSMRFNLLPTGDGDDPRAMADTGLGYAWAEFGRLDDAGQAQYYICGLGASAKRAAGTSPVQRWLFLTRLRPGLDFELAAAGRPLDQAELNRMPGIAIFTNASQYRARLADELFGIDSDAYDNLTELLKQLRKPKLGERLNPASLEQTMRDALPPLSSNEIERLADGWDRLEQLRIGLEATKAAVREIAGFIRYSWRPWASAVVRRRADRLTRATSELDRTTALRRGADEVLATASAEVVRVTDDLDLTKGQKADREVEQLELMESSAYRDAVAAAGRVEGFKRELATLDAQSTGARARLTKLNEAVEREQRRVDDERRKVDGIAQREGAGIASLRTAAESVGLVASIDRGLDHRDIDSMRVVVDRHRDRFAHHMTLRAAFDSASTQTELVAERVEERRHRFEEARDAETEADLAVGEAMSRLRTQIQEWAVGLTVARASTEQVKQWSDLVDELSSGEALDVPSTAIARHLAAASGALADQAAGLREEQRPVRIEMADVEAERERLRSATDAPPLEPLLWNRRTRPDPSGGQGVPFWACVAPRAGMSASDLDVLEAALAAAGLLDAWITPDGGVLDADGHEPFEAQLQAGSAIGANLLEALKPVAAGGVSADAVTRVLVGVGWRSQRVGATDSGVWVSGDGCWRVGPLTGRAAPAQPASYLGATARAAARRRALDLCEAKLAQLAESLRQLETALAEVEEQRSLLDDEASRVPVERPVVMAVAALVSKGQHRSACEDSLARALTEYQNKEREQNVAWADFAGQAAQFGFPLDDLPTYAAAITACGKAIDDLSATFELLEVQRASLDTAEAALADYRQDLEDAAVQVEETAAQIRHLRIQLATAEEVLQSGHLELIDRGRQLSGLLKQVAATIDRLNSELIDARVSVTKAEGVLEQHEERRAQAEAERDAALTAWWEVADAGLFDPMGIEEPDRRVIETGRESARAARRQLREAGDQAAEDRAWRKCLEELQQLRQSLLPLRDITVMDETEASIPRVMVLADGSVGWQPPAEASDALVERVRLQEEKYDAEQRQVLATLLESTFIEHLKERLDYTKTTFELITRQLAEHPTRRGHVVRLQWAPDPVDPEAGSVVTALGRGYKQLSPDRQEQVRAFLSRKIDAARADAAADGVSDWKEQLTAALDYRRWLRIDLQIRTGSDSPWKKFDVASHGAKSGGEKVVLLSQPLFAAAVVAYNAAGPLAPRWIWLDEAMTGVDLSVKESFMGLTVGFDLDVMLTAHDEWCTYPTVPAVAIYDLARHPQFPGVDVDAYVWSGGELTLAERDE